MRVVGFLSLGLKRRLTSSEVLDVSSVQRLPTKVNKVDKIG